jgi:hypothetical protein
MKMRQHLIISLCELSLFVKRKWKSIHQNAKVQVKQSETLRVFTAVPPPLARTKKTVDP